MGFAFTILGTMLVAGSTWPLSKFSIRLFVTVAAAYAVSCIAYWFPFLLYPSDQAASWQWLVINTYFKVGVIFGLFILGVIQVVKSVGAKNNAH